MTTTLENNDDSPPIENVTQSARRYLWERWRWRLVLLVPLVAAWLWVVARWSQGGNEEWWVDYAIGLPMIGVLAYWAVVRDKIRGRFWRQFTLTHRFSYQPKGDPSVETAVMFRQGHSRKIHHVVEGTVDERRLRVFNYRFTIGYGKHSHTYPYTVFEFHFTGRFPHLYCNQLFNGYGVGVGAVIPLPQEFEKKFTLRAPKEYEIEALQIFTPDLLAHLLDSGLQHDIEIVDQELLIFTAGYVSTVQDLEREYADALALARRFAPILDRFRFTPIGDHAATLT